MNYKWARDYALALIDQYSIAGTEVPPSYNNQADYLKKLPGLLDDAQVLAASSAHGIREVAALAGLPRVREGDWEVCTLPEGCRRLCGGGLIRTGGGEIRRWQRYRLLGHDRLAVPAGLVEELSAEYFRDPVLLGPDPADDAPLDNTLTVQMALPFYAAAHLVMADNAYAYAALLNEFHSRLAAGAPAPQAEWWGVEDEY